MPSVDVAAALGPEVYGYSDISALHLAMLAKRAGIPVCAPMADGLPDAMKRPEAKETFRAVLRKRSAPRKLRLVPVEGSVAATEITGPFVLSNLTVMTTLCGTPWMPDLNGCILALEDVHEEARVLDRHLTHLIQAGIVAQTRAVVFGYLGGRVIALGNETPGLISHSPLRGVCP